MFEIDKNKIYNNEDGFPLIIKDYQELLFIDEPLIFTGTNNYGNRIIASLIGHDDNVSRYFHVVVQPEKYKLFLNKEIDLLSIISESKQLYIVDELFDEDIEEIYKVDINDVPEGYRPQTDSFCPKQSDFEVFYKYDLKLKGKMANSHYADPKNISNIIQEFPKLINSAFDLVRNYVDLKHETMLSPSTAGSYKIEFNVGVKDTNLRIESEQYKDFSKLIESYIEYCVKYLQNEVDFLVDENANMTTNYREIMNQIEIYIEKYGNKKLADSFKDDFIKELLKSTTNLKNISEQIGENFTEIELFAEQDIDKRYFMHSNKKKNFDEIYKNIYNKKKHVEKDDNPKEYEIIVKRFHSERGTGIAAIKNAEHEDNPAIKVVTKRNLTGSIYTRSLHEGIKIKVNAIATKENRKFKKLIIIENQN